MLDVRRSMRYMLGEVGRLKTNDSTIAHVDSPVLTRKEAGRRD